MGVDSDQDNSVSETLRNTTETWYTVAVRKHLTLFLFMQMSIAEGSERRSTKQESAWLFRIWYNFDHKYPFALLLSVVSKKTFFLEMCLDSSIVFGAKYGDVKSQNETQRAEMITKSVHPHKTPPEDKNKKWRRPCFTVSDSRGSSLYKLEATRTSVVNYDDH